MNINLLNKQFESFELQLIFVFHHSFAKYIRIDGLKCNIGLRAYLISINHFERCENYYGLKWTYNNFPGKGRKGSDFSLFNIITAGKML